VLKIGETNQTYGITPQYIIIDGLEIRRGRKWGPFKNGNGSSGTYAANAAGLYVETGSHITIRNCNFVSNSNGLFIAPGRGAASGTPNQDFLIESNYFIYSGNSGSGGEHHSYTSAAGITFQYNRYSLMGGGADGNALKDRSAGTVIRYNWIEDGNRQLDLVDAGPLGTSIASDPRYRDTFVYGNVLIERVSTGNRQIVHYGGDSNTTYLYRKGTLHFYNNTVVSKRTNGTALFRLSTADERCDARNNIFYVTAAGNTLLIGEAAGTVELHRNWIKPGWRRGDSTFTGTVIDDGSSINGESPGFYNEASEDYRLAGTSLNVDAATLLNTLVLPVNNVLLQYKKHLTAEPRVTGGRLDVGAFEKIP
jgi:hypothetical protein